jgi:hypothetical protein
MQFVNTIALLAAAAGLISAAPTSGTGIAKRNLLCQLQNYPRLTEARVADIVDELRNEDKTLLAPQSKCTRIGCHGGTGAFLCVDADGPIAYSSKDLGDQIDSNYGTCYGHTPQSWTGDGLFNPAYQYFDSKYNILVHGSENC